MADFSRYRIRRIQVNMPLCHTEFCLFDAFLQVGYTAKAV